MFETFGKTGPANSDDPPNILLNVFNMGPISPRNHEMDILESLEYGSNIFQKVEMDIYGILVFLIQSTELKQLISFIFN